VETPGGEADERGRGATRRIASSIAEGCETRGNPRLHRRKSRKVRKPGQPGGNTGRRSRRARAGGNLGNKRQHRRRMRDTGQPGEPSPAQLKGGRSEATRGDSPPESPEDATAGQPEGARLAHPEDAGTGATRGLIARLDGTIDDPMSYAGSSNGHEARKRPWRVKNSRAVAEPKSRTGCGSGWQAGEVAGREL
jgi:hypothetical protein